ncbi:hypothetical protein CC1G_12459 [Coprinopsis cinerea okayama7|uniref:Uncharacterized protein n=1 Tax=Coprinopsis cinerea (strain Okayama-7 / 130 / ATCC MYA-4618 / FGSC 9003) TaxID=240176 RepID=A8NKZ8_COPC7|nr:hypothetical protein CC1G_12459 [Coprinopsis cinerea okayama7\|eukprot:XP_001834581.1 hypothetical protein CC1G_12459 [Coprinopsis cinerea okayama7\
MAVAPTTRSQTAASGPSPNASPTQMAGRHEDLRPTGKELRRRSARPGYRDMSERKAWFTSKPELQIVSPTVVKCIACNQSLQLEGPKKTVKNNKKGGFYHHNAKKHFLTKIHQRKMEEWREKKRLERLAAAANQQKSSARMSLAYLCDPSPFYSPVEHSVAAMMAQMSQLTLTGFQTLPNGSPTNGQHNANLYI